MSWNSFTCLEDQRPDISNKQVDNHAKAKAPFIPNVNVHRVNKRATIQFNDQAVAKVKSLIMQLQTSFPD